ncbi:NAD(P)H-binding protein [Mucilaginibacter frigoritolerans]|nr:NAD(P)H-binding protein [Mucilaginibacter frigoritolerans]
MAKKAIIAGASGLIGSSLLDILLHEPGFDEVLILVRKEIPVKNKKLKQLVIDFDRLNDYASEITGDAVFSCLGTTMKKTPDLSVYRKIDHDYPLQLAQIAKQNGMGQYHMVSSLGANVKASNFYLKTKGQIEEDLKQLALRTLCIYQPAFLTGDRKENRLAEKFLIPLMKVLNPLLVGNLKKYRSIPAKTVALAMYKQSLKKQEGTFIYPSDKIIELS